MAIPNLSKELEQQVITETVAAFRKCLGQSEKYFNLKAEVSDYRKDDNECTLRVEIDNKAEELGPNNVFFCALWQNGVGVDLLVGEEEDIEWGLTPENLWSLMYCWSFCKPE